MKVKHSKNNSVDTKPLIQDVEKETILWARMLYSIYKKQRENNVKK